MKYDSEQYKVIAKVTYSKQDYKFYHYQLKNRRENFWLYVKPSPKLAVYLFKRLSSRHQLYNKLIGEQTPTIIYNKQIFNLTEDDQVNVTVQGDLETIGEAVHYYEYKASTKKIFLAQAGSELEVSVGVPIQIERLKIY